MQAAILYFILIFAATKITECLNYGWPEKQLYPALSVSMTAAQVMKSEIPPDNNTNMVSNPSPRNMGSPYTFYYPLTFSQNRAGKSLNLTFASNPSPADQVQSRIMNKPELYPKFGYFTSVPEYTEAPPEEDNSEPIEENQDVYQDTGKISNNYSRVRNAYLPSLPARYVPKTINQQSAPLIYYNTSKETSISSSQEDNQPPKLSYIPSLGYGKYPTQQYNSPIQVSSQRINVEQTYTPQVNRLPPPPPPRQIYNKSIDNYESPPPKINQVTRANPAPVQSGYNKSPFPAYPAPASLYNKQSIQQPPPPPPPQPSLQQQPNPPQPDLQQSPSPSQPSLQDYISCICVPYYLCKDGILQSGGKIQSSALRQRRSYYTVQNKTMAAIPYPANIVNFYSDDKNTGQNICEQNKVCCQIYLEDRTQEMDEDDDSYPVATPSPEPPVYPRPPTRFPNKPKPNNVCGIQPVYGARSRLSDRQYSPDVAEFGEYPWQVAILKKVEGDKNLYLCGGVLISYQWIATVAHCVKKYTNMPLLVRLGEWDVNRKDEMYPYVEKDVANIVINPDFDPESLQNDLALLRLTDPVDRNMPHVIPACLPNPGQVYEDRRCWVSGWGKNFFGPQGEYQNVLKEVDVPVVSRALCNTELRSTNLGPEFVLHPGFLCAGGEAGKDACTGDGGSPLVCKSKGLWYVLGLVSWGIGCGQAGVPGVYVNLLYYVNWINSVTRS